MTLSRALSRRLTAAGAALLLLPAAAGCATGDPYEGLDPELQEELEEGQAEGGEQVTGPYEGPYGENFLNQVDVYASEPVIITAQVGEVLEPDAVFAIEDPNDPAVQSILVLHDGIAEDLNAGDNVRVGGVLQQRFVLAELEEQYDLDLDDRQFAIYENTPFIDATQVDPIQ